MKKNVFNRKSREDAMMSVGLVSSKVSLFENLSKNFTSPKSSTPLPQNVNSSEHKQAKISPNYRPADMLKPANDPANVNYGNVVKMGSQSSPEIDDDNNHYEPDISQIGGEQIHFTSMTTPDITRTNSLIIQRHPGETLGIELKWKETDEVDGDGYWIVTSVQSNSPASRASPSGVKEGDEVISIDGRVLQKPEEGSDFVYSLLKYLPLKFEMTIRRKGESRSNSSQLKTFRSPPQPQPAKSSPDRKSAANRERALFPITRSPSTRLGVFIDERMKQAGYSRMKLHVMNFRGEDLGFEAKRDISSNFKEMFKIVEINKDSPLNGVIQPNDYIYFLNGKPAYGEFLTSIEELHERFDKTNNGQVDVEIWRKIGKMNQTFFHKAETRSMKSTVRPPSPAEKKERLEELPQPKSLDDPSLFAQTPFKMRFTPKTTFSGAVYSRSPLPASEPAQYEINDKGKLVHASGYLTSDDEDDEEEEEEYPGGTTSDNSDDQDRKGSEKRSAAIKGEATDLDDFDDGVVYEDLNEVNLEDSRDRVNNSRPPSRTSNSSRQSTAGRHEDLTSAMRDRHRSGSQNSLESVGHRSLTPPKLAQSMRISRSPSPRKASRSPSPRLVRPEPSLHSVVSPTPGGQSPHNSRSHSPHCGSKSPQQRMKNMSPLSRSWDNDQPPKPPSKSPNRLSPKLPDHADILPTTDLDDICLDLADLKEASDYVHPLEVITEMSNSDTSSLPRGPDTPSMHYSNPASCEVCCKLTPTETIKSVSPLRRSPDRVLDLGDSELAEEIPDTPMLDVMLDQIKSMPYHKVETYKGVFGLGITCILVDNFPIIAELTERGSVAKCRNVNVGDLLVSVNGKCLLGHTQSDINQVLRVTPRGLVTLQICQPSRAMRERIFPRLQALYRRHSPDGLDSQDIQREDHKYLEVLPKSPDPGSEYYERSKLAAHHFIDVKDNAVYNEPKMYPSLEQTDHQTSLGISSSSSTIEQPQLVGLNYRGLQGSSVSGYRPAKQIPVSEFVRNVLGGSRNEDERILDIEVEKGAVTGFFIHGGKSSEEGDLPIRIKRMYQGSSGEKMGLVLKEQDEILEVNDVCFRHLTHHEAFTFLRSLPSGPMHLKIRRRQKL